MLTTVRDEIGDLLAVLRTLVVLAFAGAIYKELRTPPDQRTWHGRLLGVVPYDFRLPTVAQLREAYWNTESDAIFTDRPLGVGWAINVPAVLRRIGLMSERRPTPTAASAPITES